MGGGDCLGNPQRVGGSCRRFLDLPRPSCVEDDFVFVSWPLPPPRGIPGEGPDCQLRWFLAGSGLDPGGFGGASGAVQTPEIVIRYAMESGAIGKYNKPAGVPGLFFVRLYKIRDWRIGCNKLLNVGYVIDMI